MNDLVTDMRELQKGYQVTVNDTEVFTLSNSDFRVMPLRLGEALDWESYKHDLLLRQYPAALNRAVSLLAVRARSKHEVMQKLTERGYLDDTIEMVMYKLEKEALLDDSAFAHTWIEQRSKRRLGKARLLQELRIKGVSDEIAQAALESLDEEEQDMHAAALASKLLDRYSHLPVFEATQKVLAAMQRRGYRYGEAAAALQKARDDSDI